MPYILRPNEQHLIRVIKKKSRDLENLKNDVTAGGKARKITIQRHLERCKSSIGQRCGYVLIGEAYMRGIMYQEKNTSEMEFTQVQII